MTEAKTQPNDVSVTDFINTIDDKNVRQDCWTIINLMQAAAKAPPRLWGASIIGFGSSPVIYASGKTADCPTIAFSPRKQNLTLYGLTASAAYETLRGQLGKHTTGKGCLYIKRLSDVDLATLEKLIQASFEQKLTGSPSI